MSDETQRVTVELPIAIHKKIKVLAAINGRSMRDLFIEAIDLLDKSNSLKKQVRDLKNKLYRLEYDKYKGKFQ